MIDKAAELISCRKTQRNACAVVETLEMALPGIQSFLVVKEWIHSGILAESCESNQSQLSQGSKQVSRTVSAALDWGAMCFAKNNVSIVDPLLLYVQNKC